MSGDIIEKVLAALGAAIVGLGTWAWTHTHKRIDVNAERLNDMSESHITREEFERHEQYEREQFESLRKEQHIQRGHIGKVFDKLESVQHDMHAQHTTLLTAIHELIKSR